MSNTDSLKYTIACQDDLHAIIALQKSNLIDSNDKQEVAKEGFVTVVHTYELLKQMNSPFPHIICKDGDQVVGYALVMLPSVRNEIEVLKPMFNKIDDYHRSKAWEGKYFIMGQICIAKSHRKRGIFKGMYNHMADVMKPHFDKIITEVSANNQRSLNAHLYSDFNIILEYTTTTEKWVIVERLL